MEVELTDVAPCRKQLRVEVPKEAVEAEFEAVYEELKKVASVPGFRVGFAPRDLLEKHHGAKAKEEVVHRLIDRTLEEALSAQGDLDLVGRPQVTQVQCAPHGPMSYVAQMETAPAVSLPRYKGLKLIRPKIEVKEEDISRVLESLRESHAELKTVLEPRAAREGDYLLADITEEAKGKPARSRKDLVILLDPKRDPEDFLNRLIGMNPGQKRVVTLKNGTRVTVELKELKEKEVPALDDSFARLVGPYESLGALREALRKDLEAQAKEARRRALESEAIGQLLEDSPFDLPPSLVASQARRFLKDRAMNLVQEGIPSSEVEGRVQILTEQSKMDALKQVKLFFILRRIASAEAITVTGEELEGRVEAMAKGMGVSPEQFRKDLEEKDLLDEVRWGMTRSKVMDLVLRQAQIKEAA
ncbi:MAG: trigger factor [Candidatus Omnitrophica bacterium]|nr:trigger factor [Candidatus Omnitrophota bacterium]